MSLLGIYKIVGNILTLRLKKVIPGIMSDFVCSVIEGRQIDERILVANELLDMRFKSKELGLVFK